MSTSSVNTLSAGIQKLYSSGLLPSNLNTNVLSSSTPDQISQLANAAVSSQQTAVLLGYGSADSVTLSSAANNSLLQQTDPLFQASLASSSDLLTEALDNALTANGNAAAEKFLPQSNPIGTSINLLA
jgi:hypothetical protein